MRLNPFQIISFPFVNVPQGSSCLILTQDFILVFYAALANLNAGSIQIANEFSFAYHLKNGLVLSLIEFHRINEPIFEVFQWSIDSSDFQLN